MNTAIQEAEERLAEAKRIGARYVASLEERVDLWQLATEVWGEHQSAARLGSRVSVLKMWSRTSRQSETESRPGDSASRARTSVP